MHKRNTNKKIYHDPESDEMVSEEESEELESEQEESEELESEEEESEEESEEELDTSEFEYDLHELKTDADKCLNCEAKSQRKHSVALCYKCFRAQTINKTTAMKIYNLKADDIKNIKSYSYKNLHGGMTYLYLLKEIRLLAIKKRFDEVNPSYYTYHECVKILLEEAEERQIKRTERGEKMIASREKNLELKRQAEEETRAKRKARLKRALSDKDYRFDEKCKASAKYVAGERDDIDTVVKIAVAYGKRKEKLSAALAKHGLVIRDDSYYCSQYLYGKQFTLNEVVDTMVTMNFFMNHTKYSDICKQYLQRQYDEAKEGKYWDGCRIELSEDEKEMLKKRAYMPYMRNPPKHTPKIVIQRYGTKSK